MVSMAGKPLQQLCYIFQLSGYGGGGKQCGELLYKIGNGNSLYIAKQLDEERISIP